MATLGKIVGLIKSSPYRTTKLMGVNNSSLARFMGVGLGVQATGGTISYITGPPGSTGYTIHTFTADGTLTVNTGGGQAGGDVEYLVVGGGGGASGGLAGVSYGPGGAGGVVKSGSGLACVPPSFSVTVGAGGAAILGGGGNGGSSIFSTVTATGGNGSDLSRTGASNADHSGEVGASENYTAGGGAGSGENGGTNGASEGGDGTGSGIAGGAYVDYGGGGGSIKVGTAKAGGSGGGGAGALDPAVGVSGTPNTGGGGGGGGATPGGGAGGSGIVIVRYL